jgi:hypothetical protein
MNDRAMWLVVCAVLAFPGAADSAGAKETAMRKAGTEGAAKHVAAREGEKSAPRGRLVLKQKEMLRAASPWMHAAYLKPAGTEMINPRGISMDNGRTWTRIEPTPAFDKGLPHGYRRGVAPPFVDPVNGNVLRIVLSMDTPGLDPKIVEPPVALETYYLRYRVSTDGGKSYLFDDRIIQKGKTEENPFDGVWVGKNGIFLGDVGSQPIRTREGLILVPAQVCVLGADGKLASPGGGFTYTDVLILIGRWIEGGRLEWEISERIQADPTRTTRGVIEPTLAEMPDGRILCVMRGSNGGSKDREFALPSHKWFSISADGGRRWSEPRPWMYEDGTAFFSPSSMSQLLTHSSGRVFWLGNISPTNCRGNTPRWPLVIGEVDPKSLLLKKESVLVLDTKRDDEEGINLSHWWAVEDRETGDIMVAGARHTIGYTAREPYLIRVGVE